jgi:hypothetical protein
MLSSFSVNGLRGVATFTPTENSTGTASITLAAGSYTDAAGNAGSAGTNPALTFDATAPTQTVTIASVTDTTDPVQNVILAGGRTNNTTPTISSFLSAALVEEETLKLYNGTTFLVDAEVSGPTWIATPTLTTAAHYCITARILDAVGNQGPASISRSFILDTTSPLQTVTISAISDNVGSFTGLIADGGITSGTNWTYTPATPLTINGSYVFTALVIDGAGNGWPLLAPRSIILDAPISTAAQDTLTGIAAATYDTITNFEASDKLQLSGVTYNAILTTSSGTATWAANTTRAFKVNGFNGTFVALNNNIAGFKSDQDAILFLSSYNPSSTTPITIL